MKNIIIINFTDQILSINSQIQIDEYKNFEKLKDRHPDGEFNPRYVSDSGVSISGI